MLRFITLQCSLSPFHQFGSVRTQPTQDESQPFAQPQPTLAYGASRSWNMPVQVPWVSPLRPMRKRASASERMHGSDALSNRLRQRSAQRGIENF